MNNKTVLFFSRCELVHLYGSIDKYLKNEFNIIHVAYSKIEEEILKKTYSVPEIINFENELKESKCLKINHEFIHELDSIIINETNGRFNLSGSIQSDRTFLGMEYEEALKFTSEYCIVWEKIFSKNKIDFFIHEPASLMMNHIASLYCKKQGGIYSTHIMVQGEKPYNFIMVDHDNGHATEIISNYNKITNIDIELNEDRINNFLQKFRLNYEIFFDIIGSGKPTLKFYIKIIRSVIKEQLYYLISKIKRYQNKSNIDIFLTNNRLQTKRIKNILSYRKIKYDKYNTENEFYFYPLHLEPEAVVLYWADGIYTNQVKLIENISSQLPPFTNLYVKDHPHLYGYRDVEDYKKIQAIANVKLLPPHLPGKKIVKDSKGVITINGTAGLEAILLNKKIITFGSAFYNVSSRVKYVKNIKDLREILYSIEKINYSDDFELKKFVLSYLNSHKNGFTDFYGNIANEIRLNKEENSFSIANDLKSFFNNYENFIKK